MTWHPVRNMPHLPPESDIRPPESSKPSSPTPPRNMPAPGSCFASSWLRIPDTRNGPWLEHLAALKAVAGPCEGTSDAAGPVLPEFASGE